MQKMARTHSQLFRRELSFFFGAGFPCGRFDHARGAGATAVVFRDIKRRSFRRCSWYFFKGWCQLR